MLRDTKTERNGFPPWACFLTPPGFTVDSLSPVLSCLLSEAAATSLMKLRIHLASFPPAYSLSIRGYLLFLPRIAAPLRESYSSSGQVVLTGCQPYAPPSGATGAHVTQAAPAAQVSLPGHTDHLG